jgi:hypothetical protein
MPNPCYSGPNPVKDEDRAVIWKWAKENGIDHGLPFDKVHDAINQHFFGGQARPEWITDVLSGRKTPFREVANDAWKKQYNRRMITGAARDLVRQQSQHPALKVLDQILAVPRDVMTLAHGAVFPVTHAGDLALRPRSWGVFFRGLRDAYTKSFSASKIEQLMNTVERDPLYDTALRSKLDVSRKSAGFFSPHSTQVAAWNVWGKLNKLSQAQGERAWQVLTAMRFDLWKRQMEKFIKPTMSEAEVLDIGTHLASWANHATGSAKAEERASKVTSALSPLMFGPKLTASKIGRVISDPLTTAKTFLNWKNATSGEQAVAQTRLAGLAQYGGSLLGFLAINSGLLGASGSKQQINFTDPTKSDWLKFKFGGLELGLPGLHSEIKELGQILAASWISNKDARGSRDQYLGTTIGQYLLGKAAPGISLGKEVLTGTGFPNRPLPVPWAPKPSLHPRTPPPKPYTWPEYLGQHGPIFLQGPIKYVYDHLRGAGAGAKDSFDMVKALIIAGLGATGLHVSEEYTKPTKAELKREMTAYKLQHR